MKIYIVYFSLSGFISLIGINLFGLNIFFLSVISFNLGILLGEGLIQN